jgi:GH25 family lysozyme M1 (1,4-beta-N-acetylmuramidase)
MIEGFDASGFSGDINFSAAYGAGKRFFFGRVGRGIPDTATDSNGIDLRWRSNKLRSLGAGLKTGGYWRFFPSVDVNLQIQRFVEALSLQNGMLEPLVDIEDAGGLSPQQLTDWAIYILEGVERRSGRRPTLYTGKNFYDTKLQYWRLWKWKLCIAWQTSGRWREYGAHYWQYLLDTHVPWATGRVDLQRYAFNDLYFETFQNELLYQFDEDGMLHGPLVYSDKLLPEAGKQGKQSNKVFIVHTMVGYLNGTDSSFRSAANGLESSLGIGGKYDPVGLDGAIYQWMKLWDRADANYNGNPYAFSVETSDGTRYLEKWTLLQAESLAQCAAAWCLITGNPARLVNRSHSSVTGIGHHRIGTVPYPKAGDDYWSPPSAGPRACPGQPRIDQLTDEVIPRVKTILASLNRSPNGGGGEVDMQLDEVVGIGSRGEVVKVRDALLTSYNTGQLAREMATNLSKLPNEVRSVVIEKINKLISIELELAGHPRWGQVVETGKTWDDLARENWINIS